MQQALVDSSGFLVPVDRHDPAHEGTKDALLALSKSGVALFSTNFVRAEAHALLGIRIGWDFARKWLEGFDLPLETVLPDDEVLARRTILAQADKICCFVDATSFAVMQRLGIRLALTLDAHFRQAGFQTVP